MSSHSYYEYEELQYAPSDRMTRAVQGLIVLNVVAFAVQLAINIPFGERLMPGGPFSPPGGFLASALAFQPSSFLAGWLWQPFTYMFLHGGLMHLFLNMLWLYFFGPDVERVLGTGQFLRFFFLCGIVGVLATFLPILLGGGDVSVTGASGAAMGVMVAFAMVNPERQFFLFPIPIAINPRLLVIFVIGLNILTALQGGSTSVATHFGGMAAGYGYMKLIPILRVYLREARKPAAAQKPSSDDPIGKAVDNIFKFESKKRGHWRR